MEHDPSDSRFEEILHRLNAIERRLEVLESSPDKQSRLGHPRTTPAQASATSSQSSSVGTSMALIGRTLVVLGGAFLLRAITEAGILPQALGTALGLAYALCWFSLSDRAAASDSRSSAGYHGLAASVIAFPLLWEATVKFQLLSPVVSALILLAITVVGFAVAWRRDLESLAWLTALGSTATAWVLGFATRTFFPFIACVVLVGLITLWLAYLVNWRGLAFFTANVSNLSILILTVTLFTGAGVHERAVMRHGELLTLQLGLLAVNFASIGARTLLRSRDVAIPEMLLAMMVFVIGMGGAIALMQRSGHFGTLLGSISLVLAIACYAVAFTFIDRRQGARRNFIFYSTSALFLTLVAFSVLLEGTALALAFASMALFTAWLGASRSRATLSGHAAFFLVASSTASGLLHEAVAVIMHVTPKAGDWLSLSAIIVIAVAVACFWFPVATHGRTWGRLSRLPKIVVLVVLLLLVDALLISQGTRMIPAESNAPRDVATAAAIRTGVLAITALLLAWMGRKRRFMEATWLLYVVLAGGALKLLLEDLRMGRPATLFVSLVLYGGALIIAPRLARRST